MSATTTEHGLDVRMQQPAWIDGEYRYALNRSWGDKYDEKCTFYDPAKRVGWIMLNPSTADTTTNDPTIRRCIAFSKAWGFGSLTVVNLFARRCTRPVHLADPGDPTGPLNDAAIEWAAANCQRIVAAWGAHKPSGGRARVVADNLLVRGVQLMCLGTTKDGHPRHPLYVPASTELVPW